MVTATMMKTACPIIIFSQRGKAMAPNRCLPRSRSGPQLRQAGMVAPSVRWMHPIKPGIDIYIHPPRVRARPLQPPQACDGPLIAKAMSNCLMLSF